MFTAEKGGGCWLNDGRLRVSGRSRMIEMIYSTGLPFAGRADLPQTLQELARLLPACAGVRRFGAAALDLAYVAAGRYDGFWERGLHVWDIAAGVLLVKEAGGLMDGITPGDNVLEGGEMIVANEVGYDAFAKIIRGT